MIKNILLPVALGVTLYGATLEVCKEGCDYDSIADAVKDAKYGDTIFLKAGLYRTGVVINAKCISLKGEGRSKTIISPENGNGIIYNNVMPDVPGGNKKNCSLTLQDFSVRGGQGQNGGGVYILSRRFSLNVDINLKNLDIKGNTASKAGGGIFISNNNNFGYVNVIMENLNIQGNSAGTNGGGIYFYRTNATIKKSIIAGNDANEGGGIYYLLDRFHESDVLTISSVVIKGNNAVQSGGGLFVQGNANIKKSWIVNNSSNGEGGGGYLMWSRYLDGPITSSIIDNSIIANNTALKAGGGFFITGDYSATIRSSTLIINKAKKSDDISVLSKGRGQTSITFKAINSAIGELQFIENSRGEVNIDYSLKNNFIKSANNVDNIENNTVNINDFGYKDPANNDFTLFPDSILIGKADSASSSVDDIVSKLRDENPDIGAVEYPHNVELTTFKENLFKQQPLIATCVSENQGDRYNEGFEAGKRYCQEHPQECGIQSQNILTFTETTPKEEVIDKLKNNHFPISGYYVHYGDGAFDWIYITKSLSVVAKLEKGSKEDGTLRWTYIQLSKQNPVFDNIELKNGEIIFGNTIEVPGVE